MNVDGLYSVSTLKNPSLNFVRPQTAVGGAGGAGQG